MAANLENSATATRLEKVSFHSNLKERQWQRCSNYHTIALISHASKVMLKILHTRLQQYMNHELPDVQAGFRKGRGPYDPAIPLLGIHTEETRIERDTCTPMFITALFIIARTWKQPRCPSADEWIRKL